jgi:hypothetical protein
MGFPHREWHRVSILMIESGSIPSALGRGGSSMGGDTFNLYYFGENYVFWTSVGIKSGVCERISSSIFTFFS